MATRKIYGGHSFYSYGREISRMFSYGELVYERTISEYTPLQYITLTGTQYIKTGIVPNANTEMYVDFKREDNSTLFIAGCRIAYLSYMYSLAGYEKGLIFQIGTTTLSYPFDNYLNRTNSELSPTKSALNGEFINATFNWQGDKNLDIYLGGLNQDNILDDRMFKGNLYAFQIIENGILLADYIPVIRHIDSKVGMWDLTTNTFKENNGPGNFIPGPVKSTNMYEELEYLQSTGEQYIDTGLKGNMNLSFELRGRFTATDQLDEFALGQLQANVSRNAPWFANSDGMGYCKTIPFINPTITKDTETHTIIYNQPGTHDIIYDGTVIDNCEAESINTPSDQNIFIFAREFQNNAISFSRFVLEYLKIYDGNDILIFDLIPRFNNDTGRPGLYNLVDDTFYTNMGSRSDFEYKFKT